MVVWENIKKDNIEKLKELNNYNKQFNALNKDFLNIYSRSNLFKRFFLRKKAKVLKYNNEVIGFIWVNSFKKIKCTINQFYTLSEINLEIITSDIWKIFNKSSGVMYKCEDNELNEKLLSKLHFKKHKSIIEMELHLDDLKKYIINQTNKNVEIEYFKEGIHEQIRCNVQNSVFGNENRIPININDILEDEKQDYYIEGASLFLKLHGNYIGYGQLILEDDYLTIVNFGIVPEYRGKGYGKILLNELIELAFKICSEDKILKLKVHNINRTAINLYKSFGFKCYKKRSTWFIGKMES
ncbi:GNAT family N-acetyltransferase [Hathewaya histolytica]|uniref:GNAT family N-acetyltransferase n=1 Tax=Hathewaya histolytica TaxID=1498 RepID=UPI003B679C58